MLVLLLLAQQVLAGGEPSRLLRQTEYELRHVPSCPDIGYILLQEPGGNSLTPGSCLLCFCQENSTAICWQRQNRRCDQESYQHHITKRIKRSPLGLSDVFFRDAAREVFDRQNPEQCKPFEGSYSEGCPPDDWCIGCTVCDCDANGRWDCHILSFCDDKKGKTQVKKRKSPYRRTKVRKGNKSATKKTVFVTPVPIKKPNSARKTSAKPKEPKKNPGKRPQTTVKAQKGGNKNNKAPATKKVTPKPAYTRNLIPRKSMNGKPMGPKKPGPGAFRTQKPPQKRLSTKKPDKQTQISRESMNQVMKAVKRMISQHNNRTTQAYKQVTKAQQEAVMKMAAEVQKMAMTQKPKKHKKSNQKKMIYNYKNKKAVVAPMYPPPRRQKRDVIFGTKYQVVNGTDNQRFIENSTMKEDKKMSTSTLYNPTVNTTYKPETTVDIKEYHKYTVDFNVNNIQANGTTDKTPGKDVFMNLVDNMLSGIKVTRVPQVIIKEKGNQSQRKDLYNFIAKAIRAPSDNTNVQRVDIKEKILTKHHRNVKTINDAKDSRIISEVKNIGNSRTDKSRHKSNEVQEVLKTLLSEMTSNTTNPPLKGRKFSVIKYFKKLFKKYFTRSNMTEKATISNRKRNNNFNRRHVIELICQNTGPCRVSAKNRRQLKAKINELNIETRKILKIINVIKGLLHLLDVPYKKVDNIENSVKNTVFNDDVQKLNAILRDSYLDGGTELTQTQLTQIKYIKENTKEFINAVGRFATSMNEIIDLLHTNKNAKERRKNDPLRNLKTLLLKYNLVQNTFMQKMYQLVSKFDPKSRSEGTRRKVSASRELNNTVAIENISRSIIKNLRKLKNLAQALNSNREKRQLMRDNDDAMEYLLMLMEYLLKQNRPLETAPANDGIDLLIDAIKNAPDIKAIQRKVLKYTITTQIPTSLIRIGKNPKEGIFISDKIHVEHNNMRKFDDPHHDEVLGLDKDTPTTTSSTPYVFYNKVEDDVDTFPEVTTQYPQEVTVLAFIPEKVEIENTTELESAHKRLEKVKIVANKVIADEDETSQKTDKDENTNKDEIEQDKGEKASEVREIRTYEVYVVDGEDDDAALNNTTTEGTTELTDVIITDETSAEMTTQVKTDVKTRRHSSSNEVSSETKPNLEWIENDLGKELKINYFSNDVKPTSTTTTESPHAMTAPIAVTTRFMVAQKRADISSITEEVGDKYPRRTKTTMNPEEVMYRKQMDLLNSLDYATDRPDFDDSDSKDVSEVTDTFSSYFG